jgi:hypothetical protein
VYVSDGRVVQTANYFQVLFSDILTFEKGSLNDISFRILFLVCGILVAKQQV